ncbi:MAG: YihY/virulence factor BrkB family protein [Bradymonadales bacterium]|jgi:YihY family inner membrane protein
MTKLKKFFSNTIKDQRRFAMGALQDEKRGKRILHSFIGFIIIFYREMMRDKIFMRASAVAYTSMLSLIPLLVVGGSLVMVFNRSLTLDELILMLQDYVIPVSGETITNFLTESLQRTLDLGTGPVGAIALLVTSVMLFIQIEDVINDVWQINKSRSFFMRVLLFYAIVTMGPVLLSISVYQATQILQDYQGHSFLRNFTGFAISVTIFFLVLKLFPNAKVRFKSAFLPAFFLALGIELLKFGFTLYISKAFSKTYSILYGALGLVPVFLIWIYLLWTLTLLGVVASYCVQNYHSLIRRSSIRSDDINEYWYFLDLYAPLQILASLVRNFAAGRLPLGIDDLMSECRYPARAIEAILERLEKLGIAKSVDHELGKGYIITKPLENIDLNKIMDAFDDSHERSVEFPRMKSLFEDLLAEQRRILKEKNAISLREDI